MKLKITLLFTFVFFQLISAQTFNVDAYIRQRAEYSHGFRSLIPDGADPAFFVAQRTRLNIGYKANKLKAMVSVQDVSTWGDNKQVALTDDNDSFSLAQAWVELSFRDGWSAKLGRQPIIYDNQRVFGGANWSMQGRFHDAALLKYKKDSFIGDLGLAFSQQEQSRVGTQYDVTGAFTYKTMQYLYLKKSWDKTSVSLLLLNNGFQKFDAIDAPDGTFNRQTVGSYFKTPIGNVNVSGSAYYQFGEADSTTNLNAYELMLEATYKPGNTLFGIGFEMLSGTDADATKNNSFFPLYASNHKSNGHMDYFYVGNHANSIGLNDIYGKVVFKTADKSSLMIQGHYFGANADLGDTDSYLGTEIDIAYTQGLMKNVTLKVGYSHMFASDTMETLKNVSDPASIQNWGWAMLIINPNLFKHTFKVPVE